MTQQPAETSAHLSDDDVAAYIDKATSERDRRRIEGHIALCDECRAEIISAQDAVTSAPSIGRRRFGSWRTIGLVAAAAVVVAIGTTLTRTADDTRPVRDGVTVVARPGVTVIGPDDGSELGADRRLAWRSIADGSSYRVTVGDSAGQPVYSTTTQDTTLVIPESVQLSRGDKLFWYVDAIGSDGATATSGLKSFVVK